MTILSAAVYIAIAWLILRTIRDCRRRPEDVPKPPWEEDRIRRLRQREIDESERIGWRRG